MTGEADDKSGETAKQKRRPWVVLPLDPKEQCRQVVEADGDFGMVWPEGELIC